MFAARVKLLPGMLAGVFESNGHQNYPDWAEMENELAPSDRRYTLMENGAYILDDGFYSADL